MTWVRKKEKKCVMTVLRCLPVKMAHEIFECCIIGIRQVIDALVKPDVPQTVALDFCPNRTITLDPSRIRGGCLLAASRKPWCSCNVRSGSGSSLSQSFRTLVTLLMSLDHSSASRFVASKSTGTCARWRPCCKAYEDTSRTLIEFFFQPSDFTHRAPDTIDAHCCNAVLLNRLAAFDHDWGHFYTIAGHLFRKVDAKRGPTPIGQL